MAFRVLLLSVLLTPGAFSQSANFVFSLIDANGNIVALPAGGGIQFPATSVGSSATLTVGITNAGTASDTLLSVSISGLMFQLSGVPFSGATIQPGNSVSFAVKFAPVQVGAGQGALRISFADQNFAFSLSGTALGSSIAYQVQQGSSVGALLPGQTIQFTDTALGQQNSVTVQVTNAGNAKGQIPNIVVMGAGFQLINLPFLPATLPPSGTFSFSVVFSPTQSGQSLGQLQIGNDTFALSGNGLGPLLVFSYTAATGAVAVQNSGTVLLSSAAVGSSSISTFTITNQGTAPAVITNIGIGSPAPVFTIANLPSLPLTLAAGSSTAFNLRFSPASTGIVTAPLLIDAESFTLSGSGTSSGALAYSYSAGGTTAVTVQSGGTIALGSAALGSNAAATFSVSNQSAVASTVRSITLSSTGTGFTLSGLPALPLTLAPTAMATFNINFAPAVMGAASAILNIDTQTFTLTATGAQPALLPSYTFSGAASVQPPLAQPAIGLALSAPYALPLTGTLTLSFVSDVFVDDPSIQFATGSRIVSFTIPPNSTSAVFSNGATSVRLSTGSVAGTIVATPSFATGGVSLTPNSPPALTINVAQLPPAVLSAQVDSKSATGFTLSVTGMATGRNMTQINYHFTLAAGVTVTVPDITLNVESSFMTWFQSSASQNFGGSFSVAVPFTLTGQVQGFSSLVNTIQSVTVTLTNHQGTSEPQIVSLQ